MLATPAARFQAVAVAEALSWAGLLTGMLFKYLLVGTEIGVEIFGPIHGALYLAYLLTVVLVRTALRWTWPTTLLAVLASVPPFGSVVFERWARRMGRTARPRCRVGGETQPRGLYYHS